MQRAQSRTPNTGTCALGQRPRYEVRLSPRAERDLDDLPMTDFRRVDAHILPLADNPRPSGAIKLWDKTFRIRVGPWRIIYLVDDAEHVVEIAGVRRRREDTYRSL